MEILVATNNLHKVEEMREIFPGHKLLLPEDLGLDFECEETGTTYFENALLKAETLFQMAKCPVLADDSGLSVYALNGSPGIYSARFGKKETGRNLTADEQMDYLLSLLDGTENRQAAFVCCMVLIMDPLRVFSVQETFPGEIAVSKAGCGGFGYDPVFYLPELGKTAAELEASEKNRISHRGRAGLRIQALLESLQINV